MRSSLVILGYYGSSWQLLNMFCPSMSACLLYRISMFIPKVLFFEHDLIVLCPSLVLVVVTMSPHLFFSICVLILVIDSFLYKTVVS